MHDGWMRIQREMDLNLTFLLSYDAQIEMLDLH